MVDTERSWAYDPVAAAVDIATTTVAITVAKEEMITLVAIEEVAAAVAESSIENISSDGSSNSSIQSNNYK